MTHSHFKEKDALSHVAEKLADGTLTSNEIHGLEIPGHLNAGADSARDTSFVLLLLFPLLQTLSADKWALTEVLIEVLIGFTIWKMGRSAWLGWGRLERLHRLLAQEKWEIEHHRPQEREELEVLYTAKGFDGKLLQDVVDVLMADESRLLKVMIEEEMGLQLEKNEHPLKQGLGAFIGSLAVGIPILLAYYYLPYWAASITALFFIGLASSIVAIKSQNRILDAVVWSISIAALAWGIVHFASDIL